MDIKEQKGKIVERFENEGGKSMEKWTKTNLLIAALAIAVTILGILLIMDIHDLDQRVNKLEQKNSNYSVHGHKLPRFGK